MHIAQLDFSSDCTKATKEYLMYFKEFSCKITENMQAKRLRTLFMRRVHAALRAFAPDIVSGCKADRRALCGVALELF